MEYGKTRVATSDQRPASKIGYVGKQCNENEKIRKSELNENSTAWNIHVLRTKLLFFLSIFCVCW